MTSLSPHLVLFDGVCVFCIRSVRAALSNTSSDLLKIVPLQSESGVRVAELLGLESNDLSTIIIVRPDLETLSKSQAAIELYKLSGKSWQARLLSCFPGRLADNCYDLFGRFRYTLFGQRKLCIKRGELSSDYWLTTRDIEDLVDRVGNR